jgi:hypothetical protein
MVAGWRLDWWWRGLGAWWSGTCNCVRLWLPKMDRFDFEKTKSKDFKKWENPRLGKVWKRQLEPHKRREREGRGGLEVVVQGRYVYIPKMF